MDSISFIGVDNGTSFCTNLSKTYFTDQQYQKMYWKICWRWHKSGKGGKWPDYRIGTHFLGVGRRYYYCGQYAQPRIWLWEKNQFFSLSMGEKRLDFVDPYADLS